METGCIIHGLVDCGRWANSGIEISYNMTPRHENLVVFLVL